MHGLSGSSSFRLVHLLFVSLGSQYICCRFSRSTPVHSLRHCYLVYIYSLSPNAGDVACDDTHSRASPHVSVRPSGQLSQVHPCYCSCAYSGCLLHSLHQLECWHICHGTRRNFECCPRVLPFMLVACYASWVNFECRHVNHGAPSNFECCYLLQVRSQSCLFPGKNGKFMMSCSWRC